MEKPHGSGINRLPAVFFIIFILFTIHRGLTYSLLSNNAPPGSHFGALFVGVLSDWWVSYLLAVITCLSAWLTARTQKAMLRVVPLVAIIVTALAIVAHQGYVEFFQFQVEPFHLSYLTDWQFIASNSASFFSLTGLTLLAAALVLIGVFFHRAPKARPLKSEALICTCLTLLALVAHNRNIHLREQWFIPENLQTNMFETLYLRAKRTHTAPRLTDSAYSLAASHYSTFDSDINRSSDRYVNTLFAPSFVRRDDEMTNAFREELASAGTGNRKNVIIVLLESLRPSETGLFAPDLPSLTPNIDALAKEGIWFKRAFSSGSVTRGAQEAVLCGYASGRGTSLMRNFDGLSYRCLTDALAKSSAHLFWYHGGDGRFDGQELFWRRHSVQDLMTVASFAPTTPATGWGIGDKAFFEAATSKLTNVTPNAPLSLGIMLSLTNHIPWSLPSDYTGLSQENHPSYATTRYTDQAVSVLVQRLRESGQWDNSLVILVSDHGNKVPPYADLYGPSENRDQLLQSHINLIFTGGVTNRVLNRTGRSAGSYDHIVSQTDVASTLATILNLSAEQFQAMGKSLFDQKSNYPVLSQTEDGLYIPLIDRMIPYSQTHTSLTDHANPEWVYRFHFQAINEFIMDLRSKLR